MKKQYNMTGKRLDAVASAICDLWLYREEKQKNEEFKQVSIEDDSYFKIILTEILERPEFSWCKGSLYGRDAQRVQCQAFTKINLWK